MTVTEAQAGSAIAALWLKVNQEQVNQEQVNQEQVNQEQQPADPAQPCPQCGSPLAPPLKSSGRQVCRCGWSDKPRPGQSAQKANLSSEADLLRLLENAASESLENMKPRRKNP